MVSELRLLVEEHGVRHVEFVDDIFNLDRKRTVELLERIRASRLELRLAFPNGLRGDTLNEELIDLFARAGTDYVALSPETASARLQRQTRKHMRLDRIGRSIEAFVERRVFVQCSYMLGFPGETVEEMEATVRYACRTPSHVALFFIVTPYRGTEMSRQLGDPDLPVDEQLNFFETGIEVNGTLAAGRLHRIVRRAYLRFFLSPRRVLRILRDHPNRRALPSMALLALRRLTVRAASGRTGTSGVVGVAPARA